MHQIEPFSNWSNLYNCEEDPRSLFYNQANKREFYQNTIYNYYIHPEWDYFGSQTLYLKILFVDYKKHFCIIECIGEWNDAIENDIMRLKRNVIDNLLLSKIYHFILITENVLNFFSSDEEYYLEWQEEIQEYGGWVSIVNLPEQSKYEFKKIVFQANLNFLELPQWRTQSPQDLFKGIQKQLK